MEIIGIVILNYVFGIFGALIRFIILNIINLFFLKKAIKFKEIWVSRKTSNGKYDNYLINVSLGTISFFLIALIIVENNW